MKLIQKPFVFLRHGETAMNQQQRIGGRTDTPLNSTGQQEADAAAVLLADICWRYIAASHCYGPGKRLSVQPGCKI